METPKILTYQTYISDKKSDALIIVDISKISKIETFIDGGELTLRAYGNDPNTPLVTLSNCCGKILTASNFLEQYLSIMGVPESEVEDIKSRLPRHISKSRRGLLEKTLELNE